MGSCKHGQKVVDGVEGPVKKPPMMKSQGFLYNLSWSAWHDKQEVDGPLQAGLLEDLPNYIFEVEDALEGDIALELLEGNVC